MKHAVNGFRLVIDLEKSARQRLATEELMREVSARQVQELELQRFLSGEIPFSECLYVPARLRVFEDPRFYAKPEWADNGERLSDIDTFEDDSSDEIHLSDDDKQFLSVVHPLDAIAIEEPTSPEEVFEWWQWDFDKFMSWTWFDAWGEPQPAHD